MVVGAPSLVHTRVQKYFNFISAPWLTTRYEQASFIFHETICGIYMRRIHKNIFNRSNQQNHWEKWSKRAPLIATIVAALSSIAAFGLNYYLVERVRNDLSKQTIALNAQAIELETVKTELAKAAQRTADLNALTNQAQLALMVRQTISAETNQNTKSKLDARSTRTDEARLTPDFAKLSNDLRPSLEITCNATRESAVLVLVACRFKNTGSFKMFLKLNHVVAWNPRTNTAIPGKIKQFTGADSNSILGKSSGNNTFYLELAEGAGNFVAALDITATTDKQAIAMTKKLSLGYLGDEELKGLSIQGYTGHIEINTQ